MKPARLAPSGFNPRRQAGSNASGLSACALRLPSLPVFPYHLQALLRTFRRALDGRSSAAPDKGSAAPATLPVQTRFAPLAAASHRALVTHLCARST